ncbi:hypothetical protein Btru_037131, partial [Bulinus truncatus]
EKVLKMFITPAAIILLSICCIGLARGDDDFLNPYVLSEWRRSGDDQYGRHACAAKKLDDNSEEVECRTQLKFRQRAPDDYLKKIRAVQDQVSSLEAQFENCQEDSQRKARLVQLNTNLTDTIDRLVSDDDRKALVSSWNTLTAGGRQSAGINLVLWMLNNVPNMRDRFTRFNAHQSDDALKADPEYLRQVNVIVGGLDSLIGNLANPGQLQAAFERLVSVHLHMKPSVGLQYFGVCIMLSPLWAVSREKVYVTHSGATLSRPVVHIRERLASEKLQSNSCSRWRSVGSFELSRGSNPYVNVEWRRNEGDQYGHHNCVANKLDDNSEEVSCTTEVQFKQKAPAEYLSKVKVAQEKLSALESQLEDCQDESERNARRVQLQTNLTDSIQRILSEEDKNALASSWNSLIAGGRQSAGVSLVLWMFDNVPNMRERFTRFNAHQSDDALKGDAEFLKQVNVIIRGLESLVSNRGNPGQLQAAMERLAEVHSHMKPSIGVEYFGPLRNNIHLYIEKALGVASDSAEAKAWTDLLTAFNEVLTSIASFNIGLSDTDKVALVSSWNRLTAGADGKKKAGVDLVLWMFKNIPNMRERFTKFDASQSDEALKNDAEFLKQVNVIMGGFEILINNLDDPVQLQDRLESLADAHLNRRPVVGYDFFGPLQKIINQFIEKALGVSADSDEANAWTHLLGALNKIIKDHAIHNLGLSDVDREAVTSSWRRLTASAGGKRNAGINLVLWMLNNVPNMRSRFTKFNAREPDDVLRKNPEFVKQVDLIVGGLETFISRLNHPIQLHDAFDRIADAHLNLKPRVGLEYFGPLERYIHVYTEKALGVSADSAEARGWTSLLTAFNHILKDRTFLRTVSDSDKKALQSSWQRLVAQANGKQNAGTNLVLWMFDNVPNMRERFTKFNAHQSDDALRGDAEFLKQVDAIVKGVESLINAESNSLLQGNYERLVDAHLHMTPSVGLEYFGPLQQNINKYIQQALGVPADSDEARAWTDLFAAFNDFLGDRTDRKVLERSWNQLIAGGKQEAGIDLVLWMLDNVPNMRDQFTKFDAHQSNDALKKDAEFVKQVNNILRGFESIINNLNRPGQLQAALEALSEFHLGRQPRIGLEFFEPLQKYIHLYIEKTLGAATGSDESKAWTNLVAALNKVIRDSAIEKLGLTDNDRKGVVSSWKKLRSGAGGRNKAGVNLVLWMFDHVPNMRAQFTKFDATQSDDVLRQNAEFLSQVERITGGVESLVNSLDDPVALKRAMDKLADLHLARDPRVGLEFFGPLEHNIHEYIESALNVGHDSDEARGWTRLFNAFNHVLKERTILKIVSDSDRKALESSWAKLTAGGKRDAGVKLVLWMFENIPNMRDRFTKFNAHQLDDALKADAAFNQQVDLIVGGIDSFINNLDNAGLFQAAVDRVVDAHLHMRPSVGLEFFGPLQEKIHTYIEQALGVSAESDEARAWTDLFTAYNTILKEHSLEKIGLTDNDRKALESSWKKLADVAGGKQNAGINLVFWLFDNVPNMRDRFTKFNAHQSDDALRHDDEFLKQASVIVGGIDSFINNLNDPAQLQAAIERLVDTHLNFVPSVGLEYFSAVQKYIHLYIEKALGVSGSSDEATAWTDLFGAFNKVLHEHSLQKIGITESERKVLLSTWKRLLTSAGGKQNFGVNLVLWMFNNVPNMRDQFTKFNAHQSDDALRRDGEFIAQVGRIVGGVESLFNSLATPGKLQAALESLANLHLNRIPSIGNEFFGPLKDNIHLFIESALSVAADSEEAQSWTDLFTAFNKVLSDQAIQRIGLSDSDRKALTSSWKKLTGGANGLENAGVNLVLWMFNNVPNMRARFTKFDANQPDDVLKADPEFLRQVNVIINGLGSLVNYVNDPITLQANLDKLADFHLRLTPSVDLSYFKPLQYKIHAFIENALGVSADSDESQAWTNLIGAFNKVIMSRSIIRIVTDSDTKALTSSWNKLISRAGDKQSAGVDLVLWMLQNVPNMRNKFTKFNANQPDDVLRSDAEFRKQVGLIVGGLDSVISNINVPSRLIAVLERLTDVHLNMRPSVGLEYFGPLRDKFHEYIEKVLGLGADSDESKAWTDLLTAFNEVFRFSKYRLYFTT